MFEFSPVTRRQMFEQSGFGLGSAALAYLLQSNEASASNPHASRQTSDLSPRPGHFVGQAKSVILLFQNGGPSQMDMFDPKPELNKRHGQTVSIKDTNGKTEPLMGSKFKFQPYGKSGIEFSELASQLGSVVDDLCVIRSMHTTDPNHPGATYMMCRGNRRPGGPTLGAWVTYGLGSENQNLPAFVCLRHPSVFHSGGAMQLNNGWLPSIYRGTEIKYEGNPVLNLRPAVEQPKGVQQNNLEFLARLNKRHQQKYPGESELAARIQSYELAARMQLTAAKELSISDETESIQKMYGIHDPTTADYGRQLLLARRMVERGVRFVHVLAPHPHNSWDHHGDINNNLPGLCRRTDLPSAGLIRDLKQRGLLDETLVIWAGEFGRMPISQGGNGRDHNPHGFTVLMAGGGFKSGYVHGATDELGYASVEDRVSVPDLMATILHQLGLDHDKLSYNVRGVEETLTDSKVTSAKVVQNLIQKPGAMQPRGSA